MKRRELVRGGIALMAGMSPEWSSSARWILRGRRKQRVIIAGAGLAGLTAAYELSRLGHQVIVLEAQARVGGRVRTVRSPFAHGLYAEAGATRIHDVHRSVLRFVGLFGLRLLPCEWRPSCLTLYVRGRQVASDAPLSSSLAGGLSKDEQQYSLTQLIDRYVTSAVSEIGDVSSALTPSSRQAKYDGMSFEAFLRERGASEGAIGLLGHFFELVGDGIGAVSALQILRDVALNGSTRAVFRIEGGNDLLPAAFADRLKGGIEHGAQLRRITHTDRDVTVHYEQGGRVESIVADRLICALPFSVLRHIDVSPAFPAALEVAVRQLRYTSVCRTFVELSGWHSSSDCAHATLTDLPIMTLFDASACETDADSRILESYVAGPRARAQSTWTSEQRVTEVVSALGRIRPRVRLRITGTAAVSWDADPWARGAYCWFRPGDISRFGPVLNSCTGRIHFAGEHTSVWNGWMEGAIESGLRTAREVDRSAEL